MSHYSTPQNRTKGNSSTLHISYIPSVGTYICPLPVSLGIPTQCMHNVHCTYQPTRNPLVSSINAKP